MFTWRIYWPETDGISIHGNYTYPHTALVGAKTFVKNVLQRGDHHELERIRVEVREGTAAAVSEGKGKLLRDWEGVCKNFLSRGWSTLG